MTERGKNHVTFPYFFLKRCHPKERSGGIVGSCLIACWWERQLSCANPRDDATKEMDERTMGRRGSAAASILESLAAMASKKLRQMKLIERSRVGLALLSSLFCSRATARPSNILEYLDRAGFRHFPLNFF